MRRTRGEFLADDVAGQTKEVLSDSDRVMKIKIKMEQTTKASNYRFVILARQENIGMKN